MAEEANAVQRTEEDFITRWPLYTPFEFPDYEHPKRISFECSRCSKETTWGLAAKDWNNSNRCFLILYQCTLCQKQTISIIYRVAKTGQRYVTGPSGQESKYYTLQVQKIGQYPPPSISIPKPLENNLGEHHASLYKKALINRNEGYGLGAVSYIRRVVEDKTEELIEVVAQLAEAHNIDAKTVEEIRAAKLEKTTYDQKLRIAATVIPKSLLIDGVNPLDVLYGLVSGGLHDLTEEQCIAMADEIRGVFEYTFTRLKAETQDRKDFASKIKKWAGGKKPDPVVATTKPTA